MDHGRGDVKVGHCLTPIRGTALGSESQAEARKGIKRSLTGNGSGSVEALGSALFTRLSRTFVIQPKINKLGTGSKIGLSSTNKNGSGISGLKPGFHIGYQVWLKNLFIYMMGIGSEC